MPQADPNSIENRIDNAATITEEKDRTMPASCLFKQQISILQRILTICGD